MKISYLMETSLITIYKNSTMLLKTIIKNKEKNTLN
jgi:hypothetical protein